MKHEVLSKTTIDHLIVQEERLLARQDSPENLGKLIDDEFIEIGSSGVHVNKTDVIQWLSIEDQSIRAGTDFLARLLANNLVLLDPLVFLH